MFEAKPQGTRARASLAVFLTGVIAQVLLSLALWWKSEPRGLLYFIHIVLAAGWALGLYLSRFDKEITAASSPPTQTPTSPVLDRSGS